MSDQPQARGSRKVLITAALAVAACIIIIGGLVAWQVNEVNDEVEKGSVDLDAQDFCVSYGDKPVLDTVEMIVQESDPEAKDRYTVVLALILTTESSAALDAKLGQLAVAVESGADEQALALAAEVDELKAEACPA